MKRSQVDPNKPMKRKYNPRAIIMPIVTNNEFLNALMAEDAPWTHVTDFPYDPGDIPADRHLHAWKGDYFSRYTTTPGNNQYFTISHFGADDKGTARRRKALYRHTRVIVLDDVKEKLSLVEAEKLPTPSWILETSPGSEQWGYILNEPCTERAKVENLLDGLVANGLAPDGRDPGMKGVTRYVRLPEGSNNKASKLVNGQPFKCNMVSWEPFQTVTLEQLAAPFHVNLDTMRREQRVDGAADISDHPLINDAGDIIRIKEVRSDGRFDITCPWVDEHTGADDSGSAVFTNDDGTIGFKCHHGACQSRNGSDLLRHIEQEAPGFGSKFNNWKVMRSFAALNISGVIPDVKTESSIVAATPVVADMATREASVLSGPPAAVSAVVSVDTDSGMDNFLNALRTAHPGSQQQRHIAGELLKLVDELPAMEKQHWHDQVRDQMRWNKAEMKGIIGSLRAEWYESTVSDGDSFFNDMIYIVEQNRFFDRRKRMFITPEGYQNAYAHLDGEARKEALQGGRVSKVDRVDYAPKKPPLFEERGITYGNSWHQNNEEMGTEGDVSPWLNHFDVLGWGDHKKHILQWMAFTVLHPDIKINHILLMGSGEGCGKDFLLAPLTAAMEDHTQTISGEQLLEGFSEYLLSTKYLHINEAELGDRSEAIAVGNKLKPLAAAPPAKLSVNEKGVKRINVRNILNVTMTTNSQMPLRLNGPSRRFYAVWSDLNTKDRRGEQTAEWNKYWVQHWNWMENGGAKACIWHLRNRVDLSDFNPASPPPVTEFLRDIQDASKSPMQQTVEAFMDAKIGNLGIDLATSADIINTMRMGDISASHLMYCDGKLFTPARLGTVLKAIQGVSQMRGQRGEHATRLWVLRDLTKYQAMSPTELYKQYEQQLQAMRTATAMKAVS